MEAVTGLTVAPAGFDAPVSEETGLGLYSLLDDTAPVLAAIAGGVDTRAIVEARAMLKPDSQWRSRLDQILGMRGDDDIYAPVFVKELRSLPLDSRTESPMLSAVARSSHPDAVALMLEVLRDPAAALEWRREAFQHLAGTGGREGVEARTHASRSSR